MWRRRALACSAAAHRMDRARYSGRDAFPSDQFRLSKHPDQPGGITRHDRIGRDTAGNDGAGTDHRALTDRHALEDADVESDPGLVLDLHRSMRDMGPVLAALVPFRHIILALLPVEAVRIVIRNSDAPRHDHIVSDLDTAIADEIAVADEAAITDHKPASALLETDVGENDRAIADHEVVVARARNPPPDH